MQNLFAEIAVPAAVETLFTYRVPNELFSEIKIGARVKIPFGTRTIIGVVIRLSPSTTISKNLKSILSLVDSEPIFNSELLNTLKWISDYYIAPIGEVLKSALPQGLKEQQPKPKLEQGISISEEQKQFWLEQLHQLGHPARTAKQRNVLETLINSPNNFLSTNELLELSSTTKSVLKTLEEKGMLQFSSREIIRREFLLPSEHEKQSLNIKLNEHQQLALNKISEGISSNIFQSYLLFGITGSGKTQVYIEAIRKTLEQHKTAIVLVPEISLTPQAVRRFQLHFGEIVTVIHSQMSDGERFDSWRLTLNGTYKVVIGPRSAIFAPLNNLGLIVVDEEHESSYKQYDMVPHYNARDVALIRAKVNNAVVILGSATPSAESYFNTQQKKYTLLQLPERADNAKLPTVKIVDMRLARSKERGAESKEGITNDISKTQTSNLKSQIPLTTDLLSNGNKLVSEIFGEQFGTFEKNSVADFVVLNYDTPTPLTKENLPYHFLFGMNSSNVESVMCDGKFVVWNRELVGVDVEAISAKAAKVAKKLWKKMER